MTGSWFHGDFHNLTTTINRALQFDGDPTQNPNYTPFTVYNPRDRRTDHRVRAEATPSRSAPTRNLDTFDPNARAQVYNAFALEFRARPGAGAQMFGGFSFERQLDVNCTAPDNPNYAPRSATSSTCEEGYEVPFRKQFKLAGSYPLPWGITLQRGVAEQRCPRGNARSRTWRSPAAPRAIRRTARRRARPARSSGRPPCRARRR